MSTPFLAYRQYHRLQDDAQRNVNGYNQKDLHTIQEVERSVRIVVSMAMGLYLCDYWRGVIKMIRASEKLEGRGEYNIITDFSQEKRVMELCDMMDKRIIRFWKDGAEILERMDFYGAGEGDRTEQWECMVETAREIFDRPMEQCLKLLKKAFKQMLSPYDTVAFYRVMSVLFLSGVYENLLSSFAIHMTPAEMKPFRILQPAAVAFELTKHMKFRNKDGKIMAFAYYGEEKIMQKKLGPKRLYLHLPSSEYELYYPTSAFKSEDVARAGYEFEKVTFSFDTIRRIRAAAGAENIDYEKLFKMKYDCPCMTTFEQYMIVLSMKQQAYGKALEYVRRLRQNIPLKRNGKPTAPVASFLYISPEEMRKFYDRAKEQGMKLKQRESSIFEFKGIWMSASEASRECGADFFTISSTAKKNDHQKDPNVFSTQLYHMWLSLDRFEKMLEIMARNEHRAKEALGLVG